MEYSQPELIELINRFALRRGEFTLASGKTASYYLDCRQITLHPLGINQIALGMLKLFSDFVPVASIQAVGGMAIGADPITAGVVALAGQKGLSMNGFMVRKEAKQHGMGRRVEGPVEPGMSCIIVEDVITSGGSALQAAEAAQEFGLQVLGVCAVVDRLEGGRAAFEEKGLRLETLFTIRDLGL